MVRNWHLLGKAWMPIASLPRGIPVALANEDRTKMWMVEEPSKAHRRANDRTHAVDSSTGLLQYDERGAAVMIDSVVEAAWWAPVELGE